MPIKEEREYRVMPVMTRAAGDEENKCRVEGYASTFETYELFEWDGIKYLERIERNAYEKADMNDVLFLYNHEGRVAARQKNGTLSLSVDDGGLHVQADLDSTEYSRGIYEDIRSGLIDQMSFAFTVAVDAIERDDDNKTVTRVIKQMRKLYDVSAVSFPANPTTSISARTAWIDGEIAKREAERLHEEAMKKARDNEEARQAILAMLEE